MHENAAIESGNNLNFGQNPDLKTGRKLHVADDYVIETRTTDRNGNMQPTHVPFNRGGYNFFAIPKFMVRVI